MDGALRGSLLRRGRRDQSQAHCQGGLTRKGCGNGNPDWLKVS